MVLLSSFTLPFGVKLSRFAYFFVKLKDANTTNWFGAQEHGKEYCLYCLLLVSLIFAFVFYRGVAKNVQNATMQNYRGIYFMGYITLVVLSCIAIAAMVTPAAVFTLPMLEICLWDIFWYSLLFEVCSLCLKHYSNAQGIHLLNCWK